MRRLLALTFLTGCAADVPSAPSFQQHVLPILAANCVRCHGYPELGGAPENFRLDTFASISEVDPLDPAAELERAGAAALAAAIAARIVDPIAPMPPRFPLDDYQIETLARWAETMERGAPRPGNRVPTIELERVAELSGLVTLRSRIEDADHDLVAGELRARVAGAERLVGAVRSGTVELAWDVTGLAPGDYPLVAYLDDGAQVHVIELGTTSIGGP